jgi:hypothetical protein
MNPQIFQHYWIYSTDEVIVLQCCNHSTSTSKAGESDISTCKISQTLQKPTMPIIIVSDHYYFETTLNVAGWFSTRSINFNSSTVISSVFKFIVFLPEYNIVNLLVTGNFYFNISNDFNAQFTVPQTIKYCFGCNLCILTEALTSLYENNYSSHIT